MAMARRAVALRAIGVVMELWQDPAGRGGASAGPRRIERRAGTLMAARNSVTVTLTVIVVECSIRCRTGRRSRGMPQLATARAMNFATGAGGGGLGVGVPASPDAEMGLVEAVRGMPCPVHTRWRCRRPGSR